MENIQKGLDLLANALKETDSYKGIVEIKYDEKNEKAIVIFQTTKATVNVRFDSLLGMYTDILQHLERVTRGEIWWG